ncbi:20184_t:CDS:2 [Funneliformis geosporum]|nr:20184_t:CDS:2 [Funneliformis geosporum]
MEFIIYGNQANLITRPRQFGKSTNLSMLHTFLSPTFSEQERKSRLELFQRLKISQFDWFIKLYFGNWPVIHVSFKDLDSKSWITMLNGIKDRISDLYKQHSYILDSKEFLSVEKDDFRKILKGTKSRSHLINSLSSLARYLNTYFHISSIVLIDEYDWPMEHAGNFYEEADSFFRPMYSSVAKDNQYVHKILFVGLLPLGQASFLSGLNNVVEYPMHKSPNHALFSGTFGFTELEVSFLLKEKELTNKLDDLHFHYNGYKTSTGVHIYNPHSVISYLYNNNIIDDYWINGPATTLIKYLKKCGPDIKELLDNVLSSYSADSNISVNVELQKTLRYDILDKEPKINAIYTLLYYSGYLSVKSMKGKLAELVIPNEEFCEQFPSLYMDMVSCYDIADSKRTKLYENWYHSFILGTLATFHGIEYQVLSNRETGNGHPDVRIIPLNENKDTCIIFKFKLAKSDDCNEMKRSVEEGLNQIVNKNYRANVPGHVKVIVEIAIAFHKKSTFISARLLNRKNDGLSANHIWKEVAKSESV